MDRVEYGGNVVSKVNFGTGKYVLSSGAYEYYYYGTRANESVNFDCQGSLTVFLLNKPPGCNIRMGNSDRSIEQGSAVQVERSRLSLIVEGGMAGLLVAGTTKQAQLAPIVQMKPASDIYQVRKPWGYELWLNGQHPGYALKVISIKAGHKTSLQYHRQKKETNLLLSGEAKLWYSVSHTCADVAKLNDITTSSIYSISSIDINPNTLHRLEAVTDLLLCEASTPHLDDVVRVEDDSCRPDGRIVEEHEK